jgi:DNA-binding response OmpR family regulator
MTKVLLLDIDLPLLDLLKRKLEQEGFTVTAGSSHDTVNQGCDLVILGQQLKEAKLKQWFKNDMPIIMLSHSGECMHKPKGISQLHLPFRPSDLVELIHQKVAVASK